jgi:hypothetical protein
MPTDLLPLIVLLAIAPGYMTIYFATHGRTGVPLEPDLRLVLQALTISAVLLAFLGPPAYAFIWPARNNLAALVLWSAVWLLLLVLVAPFVAGWVSRRLVRQVDLHPDHWAAKAFRQAVPKPVPPTLWDWSALNKTLDGKFVVVEFADGRKIGGAFGSPGVSLTSPEQHGIFLAVEWRLDDNGAPRDPISDTAGVLVPLDRDVRSIHIFNPGGKGSK